MARKSGSSRRHFLLAGTAAGAGVLIAKPFEPALAGDPAPTEDISPAEDLMREHGVLNRLLLIYEEFRRRLDAKKNLGLDALADAAHIVRTFIEDYHATLEEDHIFPRFEKAGKLVTLVKTLREQHDAGRRLTDQITKMATPVTLNDSEGGGKLHTSLKQFVRMYRPHEAREDTVLFPAIRTLMTPKQYDELGDRFEDKEHQLFGDRGFEGVVERVAHIEATLGLYDLSQYTPKL